MFEATKKPAEYLNKWLLLVYTTDNKASNGRVKHSSFRVGEIRNGESPFSEQYLSLLHKIKTKRKVILQTELTFDGLVLNHTWLNQKKTLEMVQSTGKNWIEIGKDNDIIFKYIRNTRQMQLFDAVVRRCRCHIWK